MPQDKIDEDIVSEATRRVTESISQETDFRDQALEDLKFRVGDQWPDKIRRDRELAGQPVLQFNLIPKFVRQVTGDARQNVPSINVIPVDRFADKDTAKILKGMIRHIEYQSASSDVYVNGLEQAAVIGRGWWQITSEYADETTFDQEIKLKRVENPLSVYVDPMATGPCYEDAEWMCIREWMNKDTFKRLYPGKQADPDALLLAGGHSQDWFSEDSVCIAYYYKKEPVKRTLLHVAISSPTNAPYESLIFDDDPHLAKLEEFSNIEIIKSREVEAIKVTCHKITGTEEIGVTTEP
ncbi:MAG: portal protein, partial [Pyrinomonadaceae bacterium]